MPSLFFIVIIIVVTVVEITAKKKKAESAPARGQAAGARPAAPSRPTAPQRPAAARPAVSPKPAPPSPPAMQAAPQASGVSSSVMMTGDRIADLPLSPSPSAAREGADEEGCIGGSMEHTHDEGESASEHSEHLKRLLETDRQTALSLQLAQKERAEKLGALRTAVVMSEVLGRPKALRPRSGCTRR